MLITVYGVNNVGKTTHTKRLVKKLREEGHDAVRIKFPVYDVHPSGDYLNTLLRSGGSQTITEEELQLWFVINRFQFQPTLEKWLSEGKIVVAEDYVGTGIAWGTAKGADMEWLEELNKPLLQENLTVFIDGPRTLQAVEKGHIHENNHDLVEKCREVHYALEKKHGWHRVELQPEKADTFKLIWDFVAPRVPNC
jgi:thymidylate kinase